MGAGSSATAARRSTAASGRPTVVAIAAVAQQQAQLPGVGASRSAAGTAAAVGPRWAPTHHEIPELRPSFVNESRLGSAPEPPSASARLAFSRKPRATGYVPHTLADYKASAIALGLGVPDPEGGGALAYATLGTLGPDLSDPAKVAAREARERAKAYGISASAHAAEAVARVQAARAAAAEEAAAAAAAAAGADGDAGDYAGEGGSVLPPPPPQQQPPAQQRRLPNVSAGDYDAARAAAIRERGLAFAAALPRPRPKAASAPASHTTAAVRGGGGGDSKGGDPGSWRSDGSGGGGLPEDGDAPSSTTADSPASAFPRPPGGYHVPGIESLDAQHNALRLRAEAIRRELLGPGGDGEF